MKSTRIFSLVMAIVWTVIGIVAIAYIFSSGTGMNAANILLLFLAVAAIAGNWLRWMRSR